MSETLKPRLYSLRQQEIDQSRRMSPEQKLAMGGELFDDVIQRMLAGIQMSFPGISDEQARVELKRRLAIAKRRETRT